MQTTGESRHCTGGTCFIRHSKDKGNIAQRLSVVIKQLQKHAFLGPKLFECTIQEFPKVRAFF